MSAFGVRFEVLALASPPPLSSAVLGKTKLRKRASGGLQQQNFGLVLFGFGFFSSHLCISQLFTFCFAPEGSSSVLFRDRVLEQRCWLHPHTASSDRRSSHSCSTCASRDQQQQN